MAETTSSKHKQQAHRKTEEALLDDWALCTSSTSCNNGCCSAKYSKDAKLRCTPLIGGFHADICVESSPSLVTRESTISDTNTTSPNGPCGYGSRGNGVCSDGSCCSEYGWCGTTTEFCSYNETAVAVNGTCGYGNVGNGICADGSCCSEYGWCGTTTEFCSHDGVDKGLTLSTNGTCGNGTVGNGLCPDGSCCSKFGWCGTTESHCSVTSTLIPFLAPTTAISKGQGGVVNGTSSGTSPLVTSTAPLPDEKIGLAYVIAFALMGGAIALILVYFIWKMAAVGSSDNQNGATEKPAETHGSTFKFWNGTNRPAATFDSNPETKDTCYPDIVVEALEEPSIADQSLYTSPSSVWQSQQSSVYAESYPASMISVMGHSMAGFSVSGVSWPSARIDYEETQIPSDIQDSIVIMGSPDLEQSAV